MEEQVPEKFKTVGILYIVSGAINVLFAAGAGSFLLGFVGGICTGIVTLGMCPIGSLCGFFPLLLIPLGIVEAVSGILVLTNPQSVKGFIRYLPYAQIPSFALGGLVAAVIGGISLSMMGDQEVLAYLEGP